MKVPSNVLSSAVVVLAVAGFCWVAADPSSPGDREAREDQEAFPETAGGPQRAGATEVQPLVRVVRRLPAWALDTLPESELTREVRQMKEADGLEERLEATRTALLARIESQRGIARRVVSGEIALLDAATYFRDLDRAWPNFNRAAFRFHYPGRSDAERYCRRVILTATSEVRDRSAKVARQLAQLEAELEQRLHAGTLRLPEW